MPLLAINGTFEPGRTPMWRSWLASRELRFESPLYVISAGFSDDEYKARAAIAKGVDDA